jgi:hypothetical protein
MNYLELMRKAEFAQSRAEALAILSEAKRLRQSQSSRRLTAHKPLTQQYAE